MPLVNQTLRLEIPPSPSVQQTIDLMATEDPRSQYLLSVSSVGKLTLTPITVAAVEQQLPASSSSEMMSPCLTPIVQTEQQQMSTTGSSSTMTLYSPNAISPNQSGPEWLLSTPVSFCEPLYFSSTRYSTTATSGAKWTERSKA